MKRTRFTRKTPEDTSGEQLTGQVVQVNEEEAMIDIGYKTEAQLPFGSIFR